jgi:hypothetical protein
MNDAFIPGLVVIAAAAGTVFIVYNRTRPVYLRPPEPVVASSAETPAPKPKPQRVNPASDSKNARASIGKPPSPEQEIAPPPPPDVSANPLRPSAPIEKPIPPADSQKLKEVTPGMSAGNVVNLLGQPVLTAMTTEKGSVKEVYVYPRRSGEPFAVIRLLDGKVTAPPK